MLVGLEILQQQLSLVFIQGLQTFELGPIGISGIFCFSKDICIKLICYIYVSLRKGLYHQVEIIFSFV